MLFQAHSVTGSGRGKGLGTPTINLNMKEVPKGIENGLYACIVDGNHKGVLHYGIRPTFDDTPSCEVHIIDEDVPLPPDTLEIHIIQKIRETMKFDSAEQLIEQMKKDIESARAILDVL